MTIFIEKRKRHDPRSIESEKQIPLLQMYVHIVWCSDRAKQDETKYLDNCVVHQLRFQPSSSLGLRVRGFPLDKTLKLNIISHCETLIPSISQTATHFRLLLP